MKKLLLVLLSLLLLTACSSSNEPTADEDNDEDNVLVVGMECASPTFNWTDIDGASYGSVIIAHGAGEGQPCNGLDVQVAKYVAEQLGMKLEVYALEWDSLLPALDAGTIDCVIGNMSPKESRKEHYDFTSSYFDSNYVILYKTERDLSDGKVDMSKVECVADLAGTEINIQSDIHEELMAQISDVKYGWYKDFEEAYYAVKSGAIDGALMDESAAIAFCSNDPEVSYTKFVKNENGFVISPEDYANAAAFRKGDPLRDKVEEVISSVDMEVYVNTMAEITRLYCGEEVTSFSIEK